MRTILKAKYESCRVRQGPYASTTEDRLNGAFVFIVDGTLLNVMVSNGQDWEASGLEGQPWEHVSVSVQVRTPTWAEMEFIKRVFWEDTETVMQLHVPKNEHINTHENTLHMWRPIGVEIPRPPKRCV